jgi:hypothetical protein
MAVIRESTETGYTFHGIHISPTEEIAGYLRRDSGVNPAFRATLMHAAVFKTVPSKGVPPDVTKEAFARLNLYME